MRFLRVILLSLLSLIPRAASAQVVIDNFTYPSGQTSVISGSNTIYAHTQVAVSNNANITYEANASVRLGPGFTAASGSIFKARITGAPLNNPDPPLTPMDGDADGDGVLDTWEDAHGLDRANKLDGGQDPDGDGLDNRQEYLLNTNPHIYNSPGVLVGTLPGNLSVDNKGTANYSIPLTIAPGRSGLQPSLSLNYNSNGGNGPLGLGWDLSYGPSKISRGRSILARDGFVHGMNGNVDDRLYLDGRLLVLVNNTSTDPDAYWKVGNVYRTEVDSFVKITALGLNGALTSNVPINGQGSGTKIEAFKIEAKDGSISYFGRIDDNSGDAIHTFRAHGNTFFDWAIKRTVDAVGNSIEYSYNVYQNAEGQLSGEHLLAGIDYTANSVAGVDASFGVRLTCTPGVSFPLVGTVRPDAYKGYVATGENEMLRRLTKIEAGSLDDGAFDPLIRYDCAFETSAGSGLSRLQSVTFSSKVNATSVWQATPPTVFTYNNDGADSPFKEPAKTSTSESAGLALTDPANSAQVVTGDFNGDGITDKFFNGKVYLGNGTGFSGGADWLAPSTWLVVKAGDVDGDGLSDLIFFTNLSVSVARSTGTGFVGDNYYLGCSLGSATLDSFVCSNNPGAGASRCSVGDFNGDGRTDVLIHQGQGGSALAGLYVGLSNGTGFSAPVRWGGVDQLDHFYHSWTGTPGNFLDWSQKPNVTPIEPIVADFNGDGIDDYAYIQRAVVPSDEVTTTFGAFNTTYETSLKVAISQPRFPDLSRLSATAIQWRGKTVGNATFTVADAPILKAWPGDCNADGYTDLLLLCDRPVSQGVTALKWCFFPGKSGGVSGTPVEDYMPLTDPDNELPNHNLDLTLASYVGEYFYPGQQVQTGGMFLQDINKDGYPDFVFGRGEYGGWLVKYGRKDGFGPSQQLWTYRQGDLSLFAGATPYLDNSGQGGISMETVDLDGDGASDWLLTTPSAAGGGSFPIMAKGRNAKIDKLVEVTNGVGAKTRIAYKSTTDSSIYTPGAPVVYPIREVRHPQLIVSDVWKDSGVNGQSAQFGYQYSGNRLDLSGRGSLGFHSFVTLDHQTGLFKYQFLAQSFPMTGLTHRDETYRWWRTTAGGNDKFRFLSSHDNTVVFDKVSEAGGATLWPFISQAIEYRWEDSTTEHFSFTQATANAHPEQLFTQTKPTGAHIEITATSRFDDQTAVQLTVPDVSGYNPSDISGTANTVVGKLSFAAFSGLPGKISYGNLKELSTDFGGGFTETVLTTYHPPVGALTGRVATVNSSAVAPGYSDSAPEKSYTYFGNTPLVETETTTVTGKPKLSTTTTYARDALGRVTATSIAGQDLQSAGQGSVSYTVSSVPNPTTTNFDARFDLPKITHNNYSHSTTVAYHAFFGLPTSIKGVNNDEITTEYDPLGRTIKTVDVAKTSETANRQSVTTFAWDTSQTVTPPAGVTGLTLKSAYKVVTNSTVQPTVIVYHDRLGRPIRSIKHGFIPAMMHGDKLVVSDTIYNVLGQVVATSLPRPLSGPAYWTTTTYDALGRVASVTAPNGTVTTHIYKGRATVVSVDAPLLGGIDPPAQVNTTLVDANGRTVKVWNADNVPVFSDNVGTATTNPTPSIAFALDGFGRMRKTTLKDQTQTITASYDALGRQLTLNDPDKGNWSYVNSALGQVLTQTDARNNITNTVFDRLGRPLSRTTTGDGVTEAASFHYYDTLEDTTRHLFPKIEQGAQSGWIGAPQHEEAFTTGALGFTAPPTYNVHFYDGEGRPSAEFAQTDGQWFYSWSEYDQYSRLSKVRHFWRPPGLETANFDSGEWQDFGYKYAYDGSSYLLSIKDTTAATRSWWDTPLYDHLDRVTSVRRGSGHTTKRDFRPEDGVLRSIETGSLQNLSFKFDGLGNLRGRTTTGIPEETFGYDNLNRLTSSSVGGAIAYEDNGNIRSKTGVSGETTANYSYDPNKPHAVATAFGYTMAYDENGNLLTRSKAGETWSMKWTGFDKPLWMAKTAGGVTAGSEFHYNASRSRVMQLEFDQMADGAPSHYTRKRLYGLGSTLEVNYNNVGGENPWALKEVRIYVPGPDGIIGAREFNSNLGPALQEKAFVYHYDHLGSITAITPFNNASATFASDSGGKSGRYSEDAWGQRRDPLDWSGAPTPATDDGGADSLAPRGFTGHEMLDDLGLVHMNGRIYDSLVARFLSADRFVQFAYDAQSYNRYSYVRNNPVSTFDPTGFYEVEEDPVRGRVEMRDGYILSQSRGGDLEKLSYNYSVAVEKNDTAKQAVIAAEIIRQLYHNRNPFLSPNQQMWLAENPEIGAKACEIAVEATILAIEGAGNRGGGLGTPGQTSSPPGSRDINANGIRNRQIRGVDESPLKPTGSRSRVGKNDKDPENARGIARENESADVLANGGFKVEQNPKVEGNKNPDYSIDGKIYDNFAPSAGKSVRGIWDTVKEKVESKQADRIVLNLNDSKASLDSIAKQFKDYKIKDLKDVLIVKDGKVFRLK